MGIIEFIKKKKKRASLTKTLHSIFANGLANKTIMAPKMGLQIILEYL